MSRPAPAFHDIRGNLVWTEHGCKPYWAMRAMTHEIGGGTKTELEINGERWTVSWQYHPDACFIAPREQDDVENLHQYALHGEGKGQRTFTVQFEPRFAYDEMQTPDGDQISVPKDLGEGLAGTLQMSNIAPAEIEDLIPRTLCELAAEHGFTFQRDYLTELHEYSSITGLEIYVRIAREMAKKLVRADGIFHRIFNHVADEQGSKFEYSADNTEIVGYNHQLRLDTQATRRLFSDGDAFGLQFKHYHPKHVRSADGRTGGPDDPLYHPKFGVEFRKKWSDNGAKAWHEHRSLTRRLEEMLMNVLKWADIPTTLDATTFIEDDHFELVESEHDIAWYSDPTPAIEQHQGSLLIKAFEGATTGEIDIVKHLATDGGEQKHVEEIADGSGRSISTVYRALDRFNEILKAENGIVRWVSRKLKQDISSIVDSMEAHVDAAARAVAQSLNMDPKYLERKGSAWMQWLKKYAVEPIAEGDGEMTLQIATVVDRLSSTDCPRIQDVLDEGARAWADAGRDPMAFRNAIVTWNTGDGYESAIVSAVR